jgi:hypothetical protein
MRTQSPDTSLAAERYLIERIRQAPASKLFHLIQSLSQRMLSVSSAGHNPKQDVRAEAIHAITCGYGRRIGERVQQVLAQYPLWREQPVDLSATVFPVVEALKAAGISSYIGGSIASSLHGMQQSARDIDLVLIGQCNHSQHLATILATLSEAYLVEPEEIQQALSEGNTVPILHLDTLMKLDLILPETPGFDEAMQASMVSLHLDERYAPFLVASALEMAIWKLVRCARELVTRPDGIVNDAEWNDLLGILKIQGQRLDLTQLTLWAHRLGAGHLLPQALDDAGLVSPGEPSPRQLVG